MKSIIIPLAMFALVIFSTGNAKAQECPKFAKQDREAVKEIFVNIADVLGRLREISFLGSHSYFSFVQRQATNYEYLALLSAITNSGENPPVSGLKKATKNFLNIVVDSDFLGLTGTSLIGDTEEEAKLNSASARTASRNAMTHLLNCLN